MPRLPIIRSNQHYYHLIARTNNKEPFGVNLNQVWGSTTKILSQLQKEFDLKIGAFVLMNNHFHLLLLTPREDIDRVMYFFMKKLTASLQRKSGRINRIFGGRYKGCVIENERYLQNVYKYIYRNPVAAGLCPKAEDYEFSTLNMRTSRSNPLVISDLFICGTPLLEWINCSYSEDEIESIRSGLKKTVFQYKKDRITNKEIEPSLT